MKLLVVLSALAGAAVVAVPVLVGSESSELAAPSGAARPSTPVRAVAGQPAPPVAEEVDEVLTVYSAGVAGLLVDEHDAGLRRAIELLDERLLELPRDLGASAAVAVPASAAIGLVRDVATRPFCLRLGLARPIGPASVRAQLTVACPDAAGAEKLSADIGHLLAGAGLVPEPVEGGLLRVATPAGPLLFGADAGQQPPLFRLALGRAVPESFRFEGTGLPESVEPALFARYDGRAVGELLAPCLGFDPDAAHALELLELFGVVGEDAGPRSFALGYDAERGISVRREEGYVRRARRSGLLVEEPLRADDFARVPADATFASLVQVRFEALLPLLDRVAPGTSALVAGRVQELVGVDPEKDLLELLGPTVTAYGSASSGGGLTSAVVLVETRDPGRVAASLDRIGRFLAEVAARPTERRVALRPWSHGDVACTSLVFPGLPVPLELSYAVAADVLVLAASPGALTLAVDQLGAERSIAHHPALAALPPGGLSGLHALRFLDAPWFLERGYGTATMGSSALANALRSPYEPGREPGRLLPPLPELASVSRPWLARERIVGEDLIEEGVLDRSWTAAGTALAGTPFAQSYVVLAGAGIVSSVAIPKLMVARLSANENAAVATLRAIASAQAMVQSTGAIDADGDGVGEYGFLAELAGARLLRGSSELLSPPVLSSSFGSLRADGAGGAVVERSGYCFQVWLPGLGADGVVRGVAEGGTAAVDPDASESLWCVYAWPQEPGRTGGRAFYVDQEGLVLATANAGGAYGGTRASAGSQPRFDAAFGDGTGRARDGSIWTPVD